jgi:hypothetical protein
VPDLLFEAALLRYSQILLIEGRRLLVALSKASIRLILAPYADILLNTNVHLLLEYGGLTFVKLPQLTLQYLGEAQIALCY